MSQSLSLQKQINIAASPEIIWETLTTPALMSEWLLDGGMEVITTWEIGTPFLMKGILNGIYFENKGEVISFEPCRKLAYSYNSNISNLPEAKENNVVTSFELIPAETFTTLHVSVQNCINEIIYKHHLFYWETTIKILKSLIENSKNFTQ